MCRRTLASPLRCREFIAGVSFPLLGVTFFVDNGFAEGCAGMSLLVRVQRSDLCCIHVYIHVHTGIYRVTFIYVERPDLWQPSSLGHAAVQGTGVVCLDA